MKPTSVLVTGSGGGGVGEQLIKSLRSGRNAYRITATDYKSPSIGECLADEFITVPSASSATYTETLIGHTLDRGCRIVIPGSEPELIRIAADINQFERAGIYVPINTEELIRTCSSKTRFHEFLKQNGFPICETHSVSEMINGKRMTGYPYILKPVEGSGSKDVYIIQNSEQLSGLLQYLGNGKQFLLQQYVGTETEEYTVGILCTPRKSYVGHIILKRDYTQGMSVRQRVKNITSQTDLGKDLVISTGISQGKFVENELIDNAVEKLVSALKPTSAINVQCRIHNGKVYIFEVNPRFSGTSHARALVGFNEAEILISEHQGCETVQLNPNDWINKTVLRGLSEFKVPK